MIPYPQLRILVKPSVRAAIEHLSWSTWFTVNEVTDYLRQAGPLTGLHKEYHNLKPSDQYSVVRVTLNQMVSEGVMDRCTGQRGKREVKEYLPMSKSLAQSQAAS